MIKITDFESNIIELFLILKIILISSIKKINKQIRLRIAVRPW